MTRRANQVSEAIGLAAAEGLGVAAIGFLGAELMLAPAGASLSVLEALAPALVAGIGAGLYRFNRYMPSFDPVEQPEMAHAGRPAAVAPGGLASPG